MKIEMHYRKARLPGVVTPSPLHLVVDQEGWSRLKELGVAAGAPVLGLGAPIPSFFGVPVLDECDCPDDELLARKGPQTGLIHWP